MKNRIDWDWQRVAALIAALFMLGGLLYWAFTGLPIRPVVCTNVTSTSTVTDKQYIPFHLVGSVPITLSGVTIYNPIFAPDRWTITFDDGTSKEVTHDVYNSTHIGDSVTHTHEVCK